LIYLLLSILSSSFIFLIFKWVGLRQLNTFYLIVLNYASAGIVGFAFAGMPAHWSTIVTAPWFIGALLLGFTFILIFYLTALTTQQNGAGTAVIATKMSMIIPVVLAYFLYQDNFPWLKIAGVVLALIGVYTAVKRKKNAGDFSLRLPLVVFIASGLIDTSIKYLQHHYLDGEDQLFFVPTLFSIAFIAGCVVLLVRPKKVKKKWSFSLLASGLLLGVVNFFSIHFLVLALKNEQLESSVIFSVNNIAIVLFTTLFGMLFFREQLSVRNKLGVVLCAISIVIIASSV
jgi:drug/metabolite transporter (DMT)-like permease